MLINPLYSLWGITPSVILIFALICVWDAVWKGIALWKSGKNRQMAWFICIFVINTLGILPIIYLLFFQGKKRHATSHRARKRRK
jgi:methionyl-tRNA synthetase